MDKNRAKDIVDAHIEDMLKFLGLSAWTIDIDYKPLGNFTNSLVQFNYDYEWAKITINYEALETNAAVLQALRHELIHLILAPLDGYRSIINRMLENDDIILTEIEAKAAQTAIERCVLGIERIFDGSLTSSHSLEGLLATTFHRSKKS